MCFVIIFVIILVTDNHHYDHTEYDLVEVSMLVCPWHHLYHHNHDLHHPLCPIHPHPQIQHFQPCQDLAMAEDFINIEFKMPEVIQTNINLAIMIFIFIMIFIIVIVLIINIVRLRIS